MRIGIGNTAYLRDDNDDAGLARMRAHGYTSMNYDMADTALPLYGDAPAALERRMRAFRERAESHGITVDQTHGPWRWPPQDATEEQRTERFEKMCTALRATALLGAKCCVIHPVMPYGCDKDPAPERLWAINGAFFSRLSAEAERCGVAIGLENMPMPALSLARPAEILRLVREIGSAGLKICLDTGHCLVTGQQPGDAVRPIGRDLLAALHVHDNDGTGDLHRWPFTGKADWADFSAALGEIGFSGPLMLETSLRFFGHVPADCAEPLELALSRIARHIADAAESGRALISVPKVTEPCPKM